MISNITYMLDKTASEFPNKIAFIDENKSVTFNELQNNAKSIAQSIINDWIRNKPIVVFLEKGVDVIVSFMGIAYSSNFYSPIDVDMPISRITKILNVLKPEIVITSQDKEKLLRDLNYSGEIRIFKDIINVQINNEQIEANRAKGIDTDLLYVLFTSGSTGVPKGVTINHRSVIDYIDWVVNKFSITEKDIFGNQAPFYFDNSILDIYCAIKTGATVNIIPHSLFSNGVKLLSYIKENKINTIFWVPSALIEVANQNALEEIDVSGIINRVLFCGEVMPNKQLNIWRRNIPSAVYANLYGPTEVTDACTYYIVDRKFQDGDSLPIGVPMENTEIMVLNDADELVKPNEIGELCVRGTSLSMGYYNNPDKTEEVFVQNPLNKNVPEIIYRTGDLVKYNEYGQIVYVSRKDFQIKHLGHRIELGEIEVAISSIEHIRSNCCLYDDIRKMIICIYEGETQKHEIRNILKTMIPKYMMPHKYINVDNMPHNANGKIDRVELKNMYITNSYKE